MNDLSRFLKQPFLGATAGDYLAFGIIILLALLFKKPVAAFVARVGARLASRFSDGRHGPLFCTLLHKPLEWLISVVLFFIAFSFIERPLSRLAVLHRHPKPGEKSLFAWDLIEHLFSFAAIIVTTLLLSRVVDFIYSIQVARAHETEERERAQLLPLLKDVLKIVLWTMGFFWLLGVVFHVNIPALITGLGIGGVALALAAKESIENLLASFTILADKPFVVDDTVKLGALEGKVERIGFRSTRLRSADGSLLIVPNKKLIDENLENLSSRDLRKVKLTVPLKYRLPQAELELLMEDVRKQVEAASGVQGGVQVTIEAFGELTMLMQVVYHLPDQLPDSQILAEKNRINVAVYGEIVERMMPGKEN